MSAAFERACWRLNAAGVRVHDLTLETLERTARSGLARTIQSIEAFAIHEALLARRGGDYDPRIRTRILQGQEVAAADYVHAIRTRSDLVAAFTGEMAEIDAVDARRPERRLVRERSKWLMQSRSTLESPVAAFRDTLKLCGARIIVSGVLNAAVARPFWC